MYNINNDLKDYITNNILTVYEGFDKGHGVEHIISVISRSLELFDDLTSKGESLDENMVYVVAAYHDIGMLVERENHNLHSADILFSDFNLLNWFTPEQIIIMAEAVADHSTSSKNYPRSIYGMIVSDADKDRDVNVAIKRAYQFSKNKNPKLTDSEIADDVHREIVRRFGKSDIGGMDLVKFYIETEKNLAFYNELVSFAYDKDKFLSKFYEIYPGGVRMRNQ